MDDSDFRHCPLCDKGMAVGTTTRQEDHNLDFFTSTQDFLSVTYLHPKLTLSKITGHAIRHQSIQSG
jgi:hypothetical protein